MNVVFRVDSSSQIGLGHLMRCLVLAEQYKEDGIIFATQDLEGNANDKIINKGYELIALNDNSADELVRNIKKLDAGMVVFDHYGIDNKFEKLIKERTGITILSLDDTYEEHYCDILLNHNIYADTARYKSLVPEFCEIRCGSEYTLIRDEFKKIEIKKRPINKDRPVIFVSLGGSDINNVGLAVLVMLTEFNHLVVNLATTSSNKNIKKLQGFALQHQNINICINCNVAEMMNQSDVAIITPSVIAYESMYLDLPFLAIQTADNQRYISEYLESHNFLLGSAEALDGVKSLIKKLLKL